MGGESETSDGAVLATLHARGRARFRRDRGKQGGNEDLLFNGGEVLERAAAHSTETAKTVPGGELVLRREAGKKFGANLRHHMTIH